MEQNTFVSHPIYDKYEASRDGIVRHRTNKKILGNINDTGYMTINIYINGERKNYKSSRFIYECYKGLIPPGFVIDHINRNRLDNKIENLRVVSPRENSLNSAPKIRSQYRRPVIGIMDVQELHFPSIYAAGKYYDANRRSIKYVADGIRLSAYSRRFHCQVSFLYA